MNNLIMQRLAAICLALAMLWIPASMASDDHGHGPQQEAPNNTGPNGGRWLEDGPLALEVLIYENGLPPEMRIFAYWQGKPLAVQELTLEVQLHRLGEPIDSLDFIVEGRYLVSKQKVAEPHSFEVEVKARFEGKDYQWHYDSVSDRTELSDRAIQVADIQTDVAESGILNFKESLFGVISPTIDRRFSLMAPYPGVVEALLVQVGDKVEKGQPLLRIRNSQTLQSYHLPSPATGVVTEQFVSLGQLAAAQVLMEVADLTKVWVELSAFPENIEKMQVGQRALVQDLHQHLQAEGQVFYIAPMMSGGHIARARLLIDNQDGHWRPGMHVKADVITGSREAEVVISSDALVDLESRPVAFVRVGNQFEARPLVLGENDGQQVEVLSGLRPGMQYVTRNGFVLKADIQKAGASHAH
ncbi:efflux RND transporter periplasmic adaptor subunit [Bowmanella denitrificans]|uniref:efflux RND transporter periplasmic adaptor subunit n=1 Tax=Bowmanella denitrificans TaxID=366582 RepID=UPI000C9A5AFF|nr:efflux RND transporter periplasmic adaptor subunit [Bowmanella denitrificans]